MMKRKHKILFVDDDPLVLKGLKRSLTEYSDEWTTHFSSSATEALEKISAEDYDAIVTDMHMPGMDGIQLLNLVSQRTPGVIRFVFSGNVTDPQIMRSTILVHQMIPKPCTIENIHNIVERACRLRDMLNNPPLLHLITSIKNLPSVPLLYKKLLVELQSEYSSIKAIGDIIAKDTAMTAKILQLVNSAFFGLADNINSPQRAVTILGLNTVKALVLGIHIFSEYQEKPKMPISIDSIWRHSMLVSNLAFNISRNLTLTSQDQENARVSGILHDVGKLILMNTPDFYSQIQLVDSGQITIDAEYRALNTSHAEIGAYLLGIWGLPNPIINSIAFHHIPAMHLSETPDVLAALHIANGLANMCLLKIETEYSSYLDMQYIHSLGLQDRLDEWKIMAEDLILHAEVDS